MTCSPTVRATKIRKNDNPIDGRSSKNNMFQIFFILLFVTPAASLCEAKRQGSSHAKLQCQKAQLLRIRKVVDKRNGFGYFNDAVASPATTFST